MPGGKKYVENVEIWQKAKLAAGYIPTRQRPSCKVCPHSRPSPQGDGVRFYCSKLRHAPVSGGAICNLFPTDKEPS